MMADWRRFRTLDAEDRALLREAVLLLILVRIGLGAVRFPVLRRWLDRWARYGTTGRAAGAMLAATPAPGRLTWAVAAAGLRMPWATCLVQALVADAMLRRRGHRTAVRLGVRAARRPPRPIEAHAWVECEGSVVLGETPDLSDFVVLAAPGSP